MKLSDSQIELLAGIQKRLVQGDIKVIAENTGKAYQYVSKVLSPTRCERFNDEITAEAARIIELREQNTTKLLKKLTA